MDQESINRMASRLAAEPAPSSGGESSDEEAAIEKADQAVDKMIMALEELSDNISRIQPQTEDQKKSVSEIQDIMETALTPYLGDIVEKMDRFSVE